MTENELIRTVTEDYLAGIDMDDRPLPNRSSGNCRRPTTTSRRTTWAPCDPSAPVGAKQKEAYPDQKKGDARLRLRKHLTRTRLR